MKKLWVVLVTLLALIPCVAKADMGAPEIVGYYVTPISMDGANYYDYDIDKQKHIVVGKIEYGKKVYVTYEDNSYGELTGNIIINDDYYTIFLKDYLLVEDSYTPNAKDEFTEKVDYLLTVLNKDGIKMYKGPSKAYKTLDVTIPYMTELKITYSSGDIWVYTEYNGTKGWVCFHGGALGSYYKNSNKPIITASEINLNKEPDIYDYLSNEENMLVTIPAGERFYGYYKLDAWTSSYYVEYNGMIGFINSEYVMEYSEEKYQWNEHIITKNVKIRETIEDKSKPVGTLKALDEFNILGSVGSHSDYYYIEYNGVKGYIHSYYEDEDLYIISDDDDHFQDLVSGEMTLEEYEALEESEDKEYLPGEEEDEDQIGDENENLDNEEDKSANTDEEKKKANNLTPKETVLVYVVTAIVVALTATVLIILLNKNKKTANVDAVTPVVENAPVAIETPVTTITDAPVGQVQPTQEVVATPVDTTETQVTNVEDKKDII